MDDENSPEADDRPAVTTREAFQKTLRKLVVEADANGVDVRGSWPVVRGDETKQWDVEITRLARSSSAHVDTTGSPVASIVEAVAARDGVAPTDLPPLQDAIDHEVLDTLLETDDGARRHVRFQYCGYEITVRADGSIRLDG
ncbi:HalOD1 output domain-containing protein [Salinirubrum litoreum]|uniref:HalOD1 output domain-containing protein n=1 Tax=Salinirubrum litoreum TaxID=1126234 RepID=A0ABD5RH25_9EURY|nr:HalOD1 output domain-containing protein [Salinirubrum litoreum]